MKKHRILSIMPFVFCLLSLGNATRISGFDDIRAVLFLTIFGAGLCGGVGIALLISDLRSRPKEFTVK